MKKDEKVKKESADPNFSTYKTNLEISGEYSEMTQWNEMEIWIDEFGNSWEVPIEIVRHFCDATPKENYK